MYPKVHQFISRFFRRKFYGTHLLLNLLVLASGASYVFAQPDAPPQRKVTDHEVQAVILAVKDEIYAMGYASYYLDIGKSGKDVPIYFNPHVSKGLIWIIYKLMPHGEVYRGAHVRKNGLAILLGDPRNDFPPTQGLASKTIYLDDDDVIQMKTTWRKYHFSVDVKPTQERLRKAEQRQQQRYGRK